jgi:hypothetical protein
MDIRPIFHPARAPAIKGCLVFLAFLLISGSARAQDLPVGEVPTGRCERTLTANVVAFDQPFFWNRLGAVQPQGMIFALKRDIVTSDSSGVFSAGNVRLREDKRPRPITLRMNVGDCLQINFENLLHSSPVDQEQPATRHASVHVQGMQLVRIINDDGSFVGKNDPSVVPPGGSATYVFYAEREGGFMLSSQGSNAGGEGNGGQLNAGLFGAVNVQARKAEYYRSQVTKSDLELATLKDPVTQKPLLTDTGQPRIDYKARYPKEHPRGGLPILSMLDGNEIVHTDLTAIITGPGAGRFPAGTYKPNAVEPDRDQPFREFTIIYHDEIGAVQAFPQFQQQPLKTTLHGVRDAFAFNYGTGGIGAEILANRLGVGPMANCTECKYEEFFLASWAVGDPAMVVDKPANAPCEIKNLRDPERYGSCDPTPGRKAQKAFYPDDPSNVYHSYLRDHLKMRILHGGSKEHHIHHLHAHQWLHTPDSDNSAYLDSQALGPGSSFTTEMVHNGSGNRNQTSGDSIFHCHFYPHFAMGLWALWRVHDVFESGTALNEKGQPVHTVDSAGNIITKTRALPDDEILVGTPIPAVVPLPTIAMAPLPEANVTLFNGQIRVGPTLLPGKPAPVLGNPGYPFYIPGVAGHRPPPAPLDIAKDPVFATGDLDGGLPRHIITDGKFTEVHDRWNFEKVLLAVDAKQLPEDGTELEKLAMAYHGVRSHESRTPENVPAKFITNGLPRGPQPGSPFADPCINDEGLPVGKAREYRAAVIQLDVKLNKAGWHFPQQRIETLWGDVDATKAGTRPPEPLFFRANTGDCITFYHSNLVPNVYEMDDFQVKTPTDILGQHIHLVKFDVLASDGAGNGWNYEDGTFSPDEVRERIHAINEWGGLIGLKEERFSLKAKVHPFHGPGPDENRDGIPDWLGAQTTIQRWYVDDVLNNLGQDRTLRTVFTHDHFGPSTHQQVGLYSGLVVEPKDSTWKDSETGEVFGNRTFKGVKDGGPTSWRADIIPVNTAESYREFLLEFADFQHAYPAGKGIDEFGRPKPDPLFAINPPFKQEADLPINVKRREFCEGADGAKLELPCPEAISAAEPGTFVVNYRNEPIPLRIMDAKGNQAPGIEGDLSHVFRSIKRSNPAFPDKSTAYPDLTRDVRDGDPFTPLLRVYEDDRVQIRILVGAHEEGHNFNVHGIKWLFEPSYVNSGFRNSQMMGISEHFEFIVPAFPKNGVGNTADYLYQPSSANVGAWNGLWGIVRTYRSKSLDLKELPSNLKGATPKEVVNIGDFSGVCPKIGAPPKNFDVAAVFARDVLAAGTLVYNNRGTEVVNPNTKETHTGPLHDPTAIMYVMLDDIDPLTGKLKPAAPVGGEPLVLRANAGDCINVTLHNRLIGPVPERDGWNTLPMIVDGFNANQVKPSTDVGLHPQLLFFDVTRSNGINVGHNPVQTASPGGKVTYQWYAGDLNINTSRIATGIPIEFGATNLISSDPIKHSNKGAFGALIIEPKGTTWTTDNGTRASATITKVGSTVPLFREFVLMHQTDVNLRYKDDTAVMNLGGDDDAEDSGQKGFNYRTEPIWFRMGFAPETPPSKGEAIDEFGLGGVATRDFDFTKVLSNDQVGGDPVTPVFTATAGTPVRFRVLQSGGQGRNNVFALHGHIWQEEPYIDGSKAIGFNGISEYYGAQFGIGATSHFNINPVNGAGGKFRIAGDYLYRTFASFQFMDGLWGLFRVTPAKVIFPLDPVP